MTGQEKVSAAMWRVVQAARVALVAMAAHRDSVLRVARIEQVLVPAIEAFIPASEALFAFNAMRNVVRKEHAKHLEELHTRTLYWLTYVRMDVPGYEASRMRTRAGSMKVAIDRAHNMLTLLRLDAEPRDFSERLIAEVAPLYERSVRERAEADAMALERTRLRLQARELMAPVYREVTTLRGLLRNAFGPTHPHVQGLNMKAPKKAKDEAAIAAKGSTPKSTKKPKQVKHRKETKPELENAEVAAPATETPVAAE